MIILRKQLLTKCRQGGGKWISLLSLLGWLQLALCCPVLLWFVHCALFCLCFLSQNPEQACVKFRLHFALPLLSSAVVWRLFFNSLPSIQFLVMCSTTIYNLTQYQYFIIHHHFSFPTYKTLPRIQVGRKQMS